MKYHLPHNYDPVKRKYLHTCTICDEEFWGRKNKKYHPACKVWLTNHKNAIFRGAIKEELVGHKANYRILRLMELIDFMSKKTFLVLLEIGGLNLAYAVRRKSKNGNAIYTTCGYRLEISGEGENREVVITKIKLDEE